MANLVDVRRKKDAPKRFLSLLRQSEGASVVEVLLSVGLLDVGLLALLSMLAYGFVSVATGGNVSQSTADARLTMESVSQQVGKAPVCPTAPPAGTTCSVELVSDARLPNGHPNRLWRVT
ncbi:MAG TPA: hypothetical protein VEL75_12990, partial [Candidatus Methylomirabilis sp.]|nr:hypothetical protein [Candidatus Methylomirabilis sp.]